MDNFLFKIHFEETHIVVEANSLSKEILEYPDGRKTYIFETPSLYQQDSGNINIFIYKNQFHVEWLKDFKAIKTVSIPGKTILKYENDCLKFYIYSK